MYLFISFISIPKTQLLNTLFWSFLVWHIPNSSRETKEILVLWLDFPDQYIVSPRQLSMAFEVD